MTVSDHHQHQSQQQQQVESGVISQCPCRAQGHVCLRKDLLRSSFITRLGGGRGRGPERGSRRRQKAEEEEKVEGRRV